MLDSIIFWFGFAVTVIVGSGLGAMIVAKNRAADERRAREERPATSHG